MVYPILTIQGIAGSFGFIDPPFTIGHVFQLTNSQKYPLVVGNCCSAAMFNMNCMAEQAVRAENKGALSFVGASNSTYWDEDFWWAVGFKNISSGPVYDPDHLGFYDSWFHDHNEPLDEWYVTQGQLQVAGNLAVAQSGSSAENYYWEVYHLMGDPSTTIYLPQPELPEVSHASFIPIGATSFQITTEPYLYIALSINGELHGAALSNEAGLAVVELFEPFQQPGIVDLVITGQNIQPYFGTIPAISTQVPESTSSGIIGYVNIAPNPFQKGFTIEYTLEENSDINISIINIMGQQIVQLEQSIDKPSGHYNARFNYLDLLPGIYFCKVEANNSRLITKLIKTE
ncbi:MAG: C25 family cysteine peptidase [Bacteroidales bacterium]